MWNIQPVIIQSLHAMRHGVALILGVGIAVIVCQSLAAVAADGGSALHSPPADKQNAAHPYHNWKKLPNFGKLRQEYGERDDFDIICDLAGNFAEEMALYHDKKWPKLLRVSDAALDQCPVDINSHMMKAIALSHLSRKAEAEIHGKWGSGLIDSILNSGDGLTPETAWVVISVSEEYTILHMLDLKSHEQALLNHNIDAIRVSRKGKMETLYFNTAASLRRLGKQLGNAHDPQADKPDGE
jgi:hypothetical protein